MTNYLDHPRRASIQFPSTGTAETPRAVPCLFEGMQNKRLSLASSDRVRISQPITVEYEDSMFLGEVIACTQDCTEGWRIEVKVEQVLTGLQSLLVLRERLLGETVTERVREQVARV